MDLQEKSPKWFQMWLRAKQKYRLLWDHSRRELPRLGCAWASLGQVQRPARQPGHSYCLDKAPSTLSSSWMAALPTFPPPLFLKEFCSLAESKEPVLNTTIPIGFTSTAKGVNSHISQFKNGSLQQFQQVEEGKPCETTYRDLFTLGRSPLVGGEPCKFSNIDA